MACDAASTDGAGFTVGGVRAVLEASARTLQQGRPATLALVLETQGSSYMRAGALALFDADGARTGWISGGCLEPVLARHAQRAMEHGRIEWLEFDTRHDEALFSGSASGCRGRLRIALLPLAHLPRWQALVADWKEGRGEWVLELRANGALTLSLDARVLQLRLSCERPPWADTAEGWTIRVPRAHRVLVQGAGPECGLLLPLLGALGIYSMRVDRRVSGPPLDLAAQARFDAAVVMHHHFEWDAEALRTWSQLPEDRLPDYIGLLGPTQRRDDLFRVLPPQAWPILGPRLRSPVGLPLGGRGPEAIALSIAAELQQFLHPR